MVSRIRKPFRRLARTFRKGQSNARRNIAGLSACREHRIASVEHPLATLEELNRRLITGSPFCYLRFGDGDINLLLGEPDSYQEWNSALGVEMAQALSLRHPYIMKGLPIHSDRFGRLPEMRPGLHLWPDHLAEEIASLVGPFFLDQRVWSSVPYPAALLVEPERLGVHLSELAQRKPILVANADSLARLGEILCADVLIEAPQRNAYREIDRLQKEVDDALVGSGNEIACPSVVIASGCAGRILSKRIFMNRPNCQILDMGSLADLLVGLESRAWMVDGLLPPQNLERLKSTLQKQRVD